MITYVAHGYGLRPGRHLNRAVLQLLGGDAAAKIARENRPFESRSTASSAASAEAIAETVCESRFELSVAA